MTVLYFSSTGNCLYIAKRIGGKLISIPEYINEENFDLEDTEVGIVFPVYGLCVPPFIVDFIKKASIRATYLFAVATYGFFPVIKAAVVSALLFGIMHLNFNQFCYVFVLGIIFALANHASGSTWTSVIMHFLINFVNVVSIIVAQQSFKGQDVDFAQAQEAARLQSGAMLNAVKVYGVLSIICVILIWLILKAIAKNQGNLEAFKKSFVVKEHSYAANDAGVRVHSLLNVPMMFSVIIGIAAMIIYQITVF